MCLCVKMCSWVPEKARAVRSSGLDLQAVVSYPMWVMGTERGSSARTVHALNHWTLSPGPLLSYSYHCGFMFYSMEWNELSSSVWMLELFRIWPVECSSMLPPASFWHSPLVYRTSLLSGMIRCCRLILYLPSPVLELTISPKTKENGF